MATYVPNATARREPSGDQVIDQGISRLKVKLERATQNTAKAVRIVNIADLLKTHHPKCLSFYQSQNVSSNS